MDKEVERELARPHSCWFELGVIEIHGGIAHLQGEIFLGAIKLNHDK